MTFTIRERDGIFEVVGPDGAELGGAPTLEEARQLLREIRRDFEAAKSDTYTMTDDARKWLDTQGV